MQVHGLEDVAPISGVMRKAERATPLHSQQRLTEEHKGVRRFRSEPPELRRVTAMERRAVLDSLVDYRKTLLPERRHFFGKFKAVDVAFKVVGTGSVGLRDYCIYMQGNGPDDPLFLQVKEETRSVYRPYLPGSASPKGNQGKRVADGQRAMQLESDPLLGWTSMDGRDYLVRQLKDHKASLDLQCLSAQELVDYAEVSGALLARGHSRSGDAGQIAESLHHGKSFTEAVLKFAEAYQEQTQQDWKALVQSRQSSKVKQGGRKDNKDNHSGRPERPARKKDRRKRS